MPILDTSKKVSMTMLVYFDTIEFIKEENEI